MFVYNKLVSEQCSLKHVTNPVLHLSFYWPMVRVNPTITYLAIRLDTPRQ